MRGRANVSNHVKWCAATLGMILSCISRPIGVQASSVSNVDASVTSIRLAADYSASHAIFAVGQRDNCSEACGELLRTGDGGHTWAPTRAKGWDQRDVLPTTISGRPALITVVSGGFGVSFDQGDTFQVHSAPGQATAAVPDGRGSDVILAGSDGSSDYVEQLPSGSVLRVSGDQGMTHVSITPTPAYRSARAGVPAAIAIGLDRQSGAVRLDWCDAMLTCRPTTQLASSGELAFSPSFGRDATLFLLTPQGLLRSSDSGRTMLPVTVMPADSETLVTTVTALVASSDFDALAKKGTLFAAAVSASKAGNGSLRGGVFRSTDAGATWSAAGQSTPLSEGVSALALTSDGRLIAGTLQVGDSHGGIYCSMSGDTWNANCPAYPAAGRGSAPYTIAPPRRDSPAVPAQGEAAVTAPLGAGVSSTSSSNRGATPSAFVEKTTMTGGRISLLAAVLAGGSVAGLIRRRRRRRKGG